MDATTTAAAAAAAAPIAPAVSAARAVEELRESALEAVDVVVDEPALREVVGAQEAHQCQVRVHLAQVQHLF